MLEQLKVAWNRWIKFVVICAILIFLYILLFARGFLFSFLGILLCWSTMFLVFILFFALQKTADNAALKESQRRLIIENLQREFGGRLVPMPGSLTGKLIKEFDSLRSLKINIDRIDVLVEEKLAQYHNSGRELILRVSVPVSVNSIKDLSNPVETAHLKALSDFCDEIEIKNGVLSVRIRYPETDLVKAALITMVEISKRHPGHL